MPVRVWIPTLTRYCTLFGLLNLERAEPYASVSRLVLAGQADVPPSCAVLRVKTGEWFVHVRTNDPILSRKSSQLNEANEIGAISEGLLA